MRIVGGRWAGKTLLSPSGPVRPTAEPLRDAWLRALAEEVKEARILDLFAGSGALGIEALSRGARFADFVENHPSALHALKANVAAIRVREKARIFKQDAIPYVQRLPELRYDVAFADPPYGSRKADIVIRRWLEVPFARILAVEHAADHPDLPRAAQVIRQADQWVSIYRV